MIVNPSIEVLKPPLVYPFRISSNNIINIESFQEVTIQEEELRLQKGKFNLITYPPGYGKTYKANIELANQCGASYTLIIEPTTSIKEQILTDYETDAIASHRLAAFDNEGTYVCCAAQLIQFLKDGNEVQLPQLLILDEVHQLIQ